ncbi:hypothetical protein Aph01nite_38680 [Acrocarpospora phusangensis]|uniref:Uncharacterized protein n=1 Tax=Acrocarpospora phusangensis TaxID=1070424 RepID=A0A919QDP3_9ACTN|nr:hypothetical protein [Acrocarpospora phusangensis]GIH25558.1 hypothetical protein Aph01nite_38680 [Acrocarpospora phusangensis]
MASDPELINVLLDHLEDVRARVSAARRTRLDALVRDLRAAGGDTAAISDLAVELRIELQLAGLPQDHPVRRALPTGTRLNPAFPVVDWGDVIARLQPEDLRRVIQRRLLGAPAYGVDEVPEPDEPDLIRLERADGEVRLPAFQFQESRQARPLVLRINRLLEADEDPWGVAGWWLGPNAWLGAVPADLLDQPRELDLMPAARAIFEGA